MGETMNNSNMEENYQRRLPKYAESTREVIDFAQVAAQMERLMTEFEETHSLTDLHAITNLTPAEAKLQEPREKARIDLYAISSALDILREWTNINRAKYEELRAKYRRLSQAVGIINNNIVDHTR